MEGVAIVAVGKERAVTMEVAMVAVERMAGVTVRAAEVAMVERVVVPKRVGLLSD